MFGITYGSKIIATNILVYNNSPNEYVIVGQDTGPTKIDIINSVIVDNTTKYIAYVHEGLGIETTLRIYNSILQDSDGSYEPFHHNGASADVCVFNSIHDAGGDNIDVNPEFVDVDNNNYHLEDISLAINAGDDAAAADILTDYDGDPRISGTAVDIGAFEYQE